MASSRKSPCSDPFRASWDACAAEYIRPGQSLVVGLSGGLDSVSLLHWLSRNLDREHNPLRALHVHHGLSRHADAWAEGCRAYCASLAIPWTIVKVSVERNSRDGLEAAARRARHAAYAQSGSDWVILAHHRSDQAETLLFNLLRGCGVRGAGAMRPRQGRLLRPWLDIGRDAIERYAGDAGLQWVEDESNLDVRHSRNFLRHSVVPVIRSRFPAAEERLAAAASRFAEAQQLLDELARIDLAGARAAFPLPASVLADLSDARAANLLAYLLRACGVAVSNTERLGEAVRQFSTARPDRKPLVRFGEYHLRRRRGMIELVPGLGGEPVTTDNNGSGGSS